MKLNIVRTAPERPSKPRYNGGVADDRKSRVLGAETIGLIVIAVMLAIMILARWSGLIPWSAR